jgi:hypothetical protein
MSRSGGVSVIATVAMVACLAGAAGCGPAALPQRPAASQPATQSASFEPPTLSAAAMDYARSLGGVSHKGEQVLLVVAFTVPTQQEASAGLAAMLPSFGDAQVYFTVQSTDSFKGLTPGRWVVAEAYWTENEARQGLDWATGRGTVADPLTPTLESVTVRSDDPIPVVEDVLFDELTIEPGKGPLVKVPDVLNAVLHHTYTGNYADDPQGTTDQMRAVARELLLGAGLRSSLEFRSIALKDVQSPRAGTMVPQGTIIRIRIGIGD